MPDPYVIMVAPNGARRTKADHPNLPITLQEIVDTVAEAHAAGAQAAHVHVRDEDGQHVLDADRYLRLTEALRARCGGELIIQITTEAVGRYSPSEQRQLVLDVKPEAVSIAYRELFADDADLNANADFLAWAQLERIAIQWIFYTPNEIAQLGALVARGIIPMVSPVLFVLGRYTKNQTSAPADLIPFLDQLERTPALQNAHWSLCAFGTGETDCLARALTQGGSVRVGFENSLWHADGLMATSNAERVAAIVQKAKHLNLPRADAATARAQLGVAPIV